jgi:hypothetical protein
MGLKKCIYSTYYPWTPHTHDFVVLTSLTHPRKILFIVLQIGKAKDLSVLLHIQTEEWDVQIPCFLMWNILQFFCASPFNIPLLSLLFVANW